MEQITRKGLMLILSSPSGAGKTSIVEALLKSDPYLKTSVSVTTRPKRPNEIDGSHYVFVTLEEFEKKKNDGEFLEYAEVFGNFYGTPKKFVCDTLEKGEDVIFDIDWQGTQQINQFSSNDLVSVFVLPPSLSELEKRLLIRNQDLPETVELRMQQAGAELSHWPEYKYILVNRNLEESVQIVQSILTAERHHRKRQVGLAEFVNNMRAASI
jgi:guanylate kinase